MLVVALFVAALALAYYYFTCNFSHWKDKGVKFIKPYPVLGSMASVMMLREHMLHFFQRIYNEHDGDSFVGFFEGRTPGLIVRDPELIKNIMVKDFAHFTDHGLVLHEEADPIEAKNLFNMRGQHWKEMRTKLSPTFTSGRMKAMFPLVQECAQQFEDYLGDLAKSGKEFEAKDILGRYTTDVIGSCAFGIKCNSLEDPNCEFRRMGKKLIEMDLWRALKTMVIVFIPELSLKLRLAFIDGVTTNFFRRMVKDVIALRKRTGEVRKDFMQLLIELKDKGFLSPEEGDENVGDEPADHKKLELTDDDIMAQAAVFFLAGFETSSTVLSFALLELAVNQDVQQKLRREIQEVIQNHGGQVTYQAIMDMKYMDCVLQEALRMYPPVPTHMRVCTKQYLIPGTKVVIEEGTKVQIPNYALQNDPKYFPEPEKFDPDRFDEDQRNKHQYIYTPFGDGPRQCIGNRFALMQSKLGLISVIRKYNVVPSARTKYPVTIDPKSFMLLAKDGAWVKVEPAKQESN